MKIIHAIVRLDIVCDDDNATDQEQLALVQEGIGMGGINYFRTGIEYTVQSVGLLPEVTNE